MDLTSHAGDLSEAEHTLTHAFTVGESSPLWVPLTSHAVTAYIRPIILSKVRARLDKMPGIQALPLSLQSVHDLVRKYRNTTIAHSQSDLTMPLGRVPRAHQSTPEKANELRKRVAAGQQKACLARKYGISRETLYQYLKTTSKKTRPGALDAGDVGQTNVSGHLHRSIHSASAGAGDFGN